MITIKQGENFLLSLTLKDENGDDVPVSQIKSFKIEALHGSALLAKWIWLPDSSGDPHIVIVDGLAKLEVESSTTLSWLGEIEFRVVPSWVDTDYFIAGAQTDVVCFSGLLTVEKC